MNVINLHKIVINQKKMVSELFGTLSTKRITKYDLMRNDQ